MNFSCTQEKVQNKKGVRKSVSARYFNKSRNGWQRPVVEIGKNTDLKTSVQFRKSQEQGGQWNFQNNSRTIQEHFKNIFTFFKKPYKQIFKNISCSKQLIFINEGFGLCQFRKKILKSEIPEHFQNKPEKVHFSRTIPVHNSRTIQGFQEIPELLATLNFANLIMTHFSRGLNFAILRFFQNFTGVLLHFSAG